MADDDPPCDALRAGPLFGPAAPLWRLVPTRGGDGRCLADFMMLIPGLGNRPPASRERVANAIREVCESYGEQVTFADVNYAINVLWVSVVAEPCLAGRVAQSIRARVPEALLIGGALGTASLPTVRRRGTAGLWRPVRVLVRRAVRRLTGPGG